MLITFRLQCNVHNSFKSQSFWRLPLVSKWLQKTLHDKLLSFSLAVSRPTRAFTCSSENEGIRAANARRLCLCVFLSDSVVSSFASSLYMLITRLRSRVAGRFSRRLIADRVWFPGMQAIKVTLCERESICAWADAAACVCVWVLCANTCVNVRRAIRHAEF